MSNRVGKQLNFILDGESLGEDILIERDEHVIWLMWEGGYDIDRIW